MPKRKASNSPEQESLAKKLRKCQKEYNTEIYKKIEQDCLKIVQENKSSYFLKEKSSPEINAFLKQEELSFKYGNNKKCSCGNNDYQYEHLCKCNIQIGYTITW